MARTIADLSIGDMVSFRTASGILVTRRVVAVGRATFQYEDQPYFLDSEGNTNWEGAVSIVNPDEVAEQKASRSRQAGATALRHADVSRKTIREILFYSNDGQSSFEEEVKDVLGTSKEAGKSAVNGWKSFWTWIPSQFPKASPFDLDSPMVYSLVGFKAPGINEVSKARLFRPGFTLKVVDNGDGRMPRPFLGRYITKAGLALIIFGALFVAAIVINILSQ